MTTHVEHVDRMEHPTDTKSFANGEMNAEPHATQPYPPPQASSEAGDNEFAPPGPQPTTRHDEHVAAPQFLPFVGYIEPPVGTYPSTAYMVMPYGGYYTAGYYYDPSSLTSTSTHPSPMYAGYPVAMDASMTAAAYPYGFMPVQPPPQHPSHQHRPAHMHTSPPAGTPVHSGYGTPVMRPHAPGPGGGMRGRRHSSMTAPPSLSHFPVRSSSGSAINHFPRGESNGHSGPVMSRTPSAAYAPAYKHPKDLAMWVGNLPDDTVTEELYAFFSDPQVESIHHLPKSNCAFVNFKSRDALLAGLEKYHNKEFHGARLVCRPQRPLSQESLQPVAWPNFPNTFNVPPRYQNHTSANSSPSRKCKERFFILKSLTQDDLDISVGTGLWATQPRNEAMLNNAYKDADTVYLIYSANKSGEFYGFARMAGQISTPSRKVHWAPVHKDEQAGSSDEKEDENNRGEAQGPHNGLGEQQGEGEEGETDEEKTDYGEEGGKDKRWGSEFKVQWMMLQKLPFTQTRHLRNPWNANREVKVSRDGTELETSVGEALIREFYRYEQMQRELAAIPALQKSPPPMASGAGLGNAAVRPARPPPQFGVHPPTHPGAVYHQGLPMAPSQTTPHPQGGVMWHKQAAGAYAASYRPPVYPGSGGPHPHPTHVPVPHPPPTQQEHPTNQQPPQQPQPFRQEAWEQPQPQPQPPQQAQPWYAGPVPPYYAYPMGNHPPQPHQPSPLIPMLPPPVSDTVTSPTSEDSKAEQAAGTKNSAADEVLDKEVEKGMKNLAITEKGA
ncbi:uncharacterized protein VTP21DRAFT_10965 [Calcarisporiella thermophila]|uniref:uncharacterized protein n=1 Tax=Calcarisporiella thermophila TaxID=911321 RepID=UPI0037420148